MTLTGAVQEGKLGKTRQRTDKTRYKQQDKNKKEKKDYTGYPSEPVTRTETNTQEREQHWVPQEFTKLKTRFKTGVFSKRRQCATKPDREGKS